MSEADDAVVAELAAELGYPNQPRALHSRIRAVTEDDYPIAFIQANRICIIEVGFQVEILGLVVSAATRRSGIGRRLIAEVERWAEEVGAEAIVVRSNTKRKGSHIFYPAMGYTATKTQAVYEKRLSR